MKIFRTQNLTGKIFLVNILLAFSLLNNSANAATKTWNNGAAGGVWTTGANWVGGVAPVATDDIVINPTAAIVITAVPTLSINSLVIGGSNSVTLQSAAAVTLTIVNGALATDLNVVAGSTLVIDNTITISCITAGAVGNIAGTITVQGSVGGALTTTAAITTFAAGSFYNHARNGGTIPLATWNATSTCNITGITTTNPTTGAQTFGHFIWNCSGQTSATGAISAAMTVAGNLTVTAGTLADGGFTITGNAANVFSVASGATYTTTKTASPWMPTLFTAANIQLNSGSTFNYNGATAHNITATPNGSATLTTYGILGIGGAVIKTLATTVTVNGLIINTTATLADGGFQITGNALGNLTMLGTGTLTLGTAATATVFPTNFINANISIASGSIVIYNSNAAQNISNIPTYGVLNTVASGAVTKTLLGNTTVTGNFNNGANNTFDVAGYNLTLGGSFTNSGTITANAATSTLTFNGTANQSFNVGTYTGSLISNYICINTAAGNGNSVGTNFNVGNLTVNATGNMSINSSTTVFISKDFINNGNFQTNTTTAIVNMNGSILQTISGAGVFTTGTAGRINNLTINNSSGLNPAVNLNVNIAVQTGLNLTAGILGGTGTLTVGVAGTAVTTTRTAGSLANVPTWGFTTGAYAITYNGGAAINTDKELPSSATPTNGVLTVSTAGTNVTLTADANIGTLTTSVAATTTFNLNGFTLGLSLASPVSNTGVITANGATSTLKFNGTVAQTFTLAGTYTGSVISNMIVDNSFSTSGLTLGTTNINVNYLTVNAARFFTLGGLNINVKNDLNNNGTITSTTAGSTITMNGIAAQQIQSSGSTGVWTTGTAGRLLNLIINNSAGVSLNANTSFAIQTSLTLTNGTFTATTLTIGIAGTAVTTTRTAGVLANVPTWGFTTGAYAIIYNGGVAINTDKELPVAATPTNGVLTVSIAGTNVTLTANANIGTLTTSIATTTTFNVNGFTLGLSLATAVNNTGVLISNSAGSTLKLNGVVAQTLAIAGTNTNGVDNLIIATTVTPTTTLGSSVKVNNLTINAGSTFSLGASGYTFSLTGTYSNSGTLNAASSSIFQFTSASAQTFTVGTYTSSAIFNFKLNGTGGVTLNAPVNATTLTLTSGNLTSSSVNFPTVTGTTIASVGGGSASSYVNGPLARTLPASLVSGSTYGFPIGKSAYQLYQMVNPTTNAGGTVVIKTEVFDANAGGTSGPGVGALNTNRYWNASVTSGGANLTSAGKIALTETGLVNGTDHITNSSTQTGSYSIYASGVVASILTTNNAGPIALGYFVIGKGGVLSGTYTVGTASQFLSFTNGGGIFEAMNAGTLSGNVVASVTSDIAIESGNAALNQWVESGAGNYTFIIQSDNGTTRTMSGSYNGATVATNGLFRFDGADRVTINGGTLAQRQLVFRNTNTAGTQNATIQFLNDATNNQVNNCIIEGGTTNGSTGTILFGTTTGTTGNDYITIDRCDIRDLTTASATPSNCIYANGNATAGKENSTITISNCNIFNFYYSAGVDHAGINIQGGNTGWTITGNSFYQTASRSLAGSEMDGINIANTSGYGFTITNNYIGGNSANCGGTAFTITGTAKFRGIRCSTSQTLAATSIQGNTIQNISVTSSTASTANAGISLPSGQFNCGNVTPNIIGSQTIYNSIIYSSSVAACAFSGIQISSGGSPGTILISNNKIGGIVCAGASTSNQVFGISVNQGYPTVQSNLITTLSNTSATTGTNGASSVIGISSSSQTTGQVTIQQNSIYGLSNAAATASIMGVCIYPTAGASTSLIARNFIHSFNTTSTTAVQHGINISQSGTASGIATIQNNKIRLGLDTTGAAITTSASLIGIYKNTTVSSKILFNTVYIAGTGVTGGTVITAACQRVSSGASDEIFDNIFYNARSRSSGTAIYYAYVLNAGTSLSSDYNIYNATGTASVAAIVGASACTNLQILRSNVSSQDLHSGIGDPNFITPNGSASTINLNLNNATPAEGSGGNTTVTVTDDFSGTTRTTVTPIDIGANAGNFNSLVAATDIFSPNISYTALTNQATCATTVTLTATITDVGTGVPTSGANKPRVYFRRSTGAGAPTGWASNAGTLTSGNGNNGTWSFVIDYSLLTPTTLAVADVYQYYVVAQDQATNSVNPNIWFSKFDATTPTFTNNNVNTPATHPATPDSYTIQTSISGTVYVGTGAGTPSYPTFNGVGGLFPALNSGVLTSDLVVIVQNNVTETTSAGLNSLNYSCGGPYKITIKPDQSSATIRTISGSVANSLIQFSGADSIFIDGNISGAGRYLVFENTNAGTGINLASTFYLTNDSRRISISNVEIKGYTSNTSSGVIFIGAGTIVGNDYVTVNNSLIHEKSGGGYPIQLIYSNGLATAPNDNISITNNNIYNWSSFGGGTGGRTAMAMNVTATGNGSNWTITGNSFYNQFIDGTGYQQGIYFTPGAASNNNIISNNYIGGNNPLCVGTGGVPYWANNYDDLATGLNEMDIVNLNCGTVTLTGNTIKRIRNTNSDNSGVVVFWVQGSTAPIFTSNTIGDAGGAVADQVVAYGGGAVGLYFSPGYIYGIYSSTSGTVTVDQNNFYYLAQLGAYTGGGSYAVYHSGAGQITVTTNNIIGAQASGIGYDSYAIKIVPSTTISGVLINNNVIDGPYILDNAGSFITTTAIFVNGANLAGTINNNRVYDMRNNSPDGQVEGIWLNGSGNWTLKNNQVSLGNYSSITPTNSLGIFGIENDLSNAFASSVTAYYNTVIIGGSQSTGTSTFDNSMAFVRYPGQSGTVTGDVTTLANNIFINNRTGGTTAKHYAIVNYGTSNFATNWNAGASNYNFIASNNAATLGIWGATDKTFANWISASSGDANSWNVNTVTAGSSTATQLNPTDLFTSVTLGNLNINPANQALWFVNGKGVAGALSGSINSDYGGGTRGTTYGYATDIGADEFNANTGVYPFALTAIPALSGTNTFTFAGRTVGSVTWGASGTVPTSVSCEYYSGDAPGTNPSPAFPGSYNNADFTYRISATGGSGYTYDVTLNYDDADKGDFAVAPEGSMMLIKTNPANNWITRSTTINTASNIMTSSGLTDFSFFTGSDGSILPIQLSSFTVETYQTINALLKWTTASELNNNYFEVEVATVTDNSGNLVFRKLGEVDGNGTSLIEHQYQFIDTESGKSGTRYYRVKQVDFNGQFTYTMIKSLQFENAITVLGEFYPNPTFDWINISVDQKLIKDLNLKITSIDGRIVDLKNISIIQSEIGLSIDASALSSGIYFIQFYNKANSINETKRFVKIQ